MDNNSKDIINSFKKTVISDELCKISESASEMAIDSVLDDGLLNEDVPLIGTIIGLYKLGKTISARQQLKKLLKFLFQLNEVSQADRIKFLGRVEEDKTYRDELFEKTLFIIERLDDEMKSEIIGRLFKNLILEKIKTDEFFRISLIIDKTYLNDLFYLDIGYNMNCKVPEYEQHKFHQENDTNFINENLTTTGLLTKESVENKARQSAMSDGKITYITRFELTGIGETLIEFGF
jgi:hypothetical protein